MLFYSLIGLCLVLLGTSGLQFVYLFYLDRVDKERKRHIHDLELQCKRLSARLSDAERRIAEQERIISAISIDSEDEMWADIIEER